MFYDRVGLILFFVIGDLICQQRRIRSHFIFEVCRFIFLRNQDAQFSSVNEFAIFIECQQVIDGAIATGNTIYLYDKEIAEPVFNEGIGVCRRIIGGIKIIVEEKPYQRNRNLCLCIEAGHRIFGKIFL